MNQRIPRRQMMPDRPFRPNDGYIHGDTKALCPRPSASLSDETLTKTQDPTRGRRWPASKPSKTSRLARELRRFPNKMAARRDGRVVDGGGLENHCTRKG